VSVRRRFAYRSRAGLQKSCTTSPKQAAMIRSLFVSMGGTQQGARRPKAVPPTNFNAFGITAGFWERASAYLRRGRHRFRCSSPRDQESADREGSFAQTDHFPRSTAASCHEAEREAAACAHPARRRLSGTQIRLRIWSSGGVRRSQRHGDTIKNGASRHRPTGHLWFEYVYACPFSSSPGGHRRRRPARFHRLHFFFARSSA